MASSVDIVPALGHGLVTSQVGPSAGFDAIDDRRFWSVGLQEGVISAGSYEVTQRAAGANMTVDVAASTGDGALVQGDSVTGQGLYRIAPHTAAINLDVAAANATNPRVDRVVLESKDDAHDVGGLNVARVRVISGTATSGATLDNLTGAAAVPSSCLLLADVHIPATDTTISNSQIRDRRTWARGAYVNMSKTAQATRTNATVAEADTANLKRRIELAGLAPVRFFVSGTFRSTVADAGGVLDIMVGGVARNDFLPLTASAPTTDGLIACRWEYPAATLGAGSFLISLGFASSTGGTTLDLNGTSSRPIRFTIEELLRQDSGNNTTTTG